MAPERSWPGVATGCTRRPRPPPRWRARRLPVGVSGPRPDRFGRLAAGLHVAFYLRRDPAGWVVSVHRDLRPDLVAAAEALVQAGLFELTERSLRWPEVAEDLLAVV